jgi:hypothetical protein
MAYRFAKHYTHDEARALLPQIRKWLKRMGHLRQEVETCDGRLNALRRTGPDLGGEIVNTWVRVLAEIRELLLEFYQREIQIKDLERGLIDFPAIIGGKEVFLCWELQETDIGYWHDLDAGYAGRRPLKGTF